jgi:Ca2+-transporting ATPase
VEVKMITGDHPDTARQVAEEIGLLPGGEVVTGEELEKLGEEEFLDRVERVRVFARTSPEAKLRIVRALRRRGQVVAMTGDGVNDAPALREADIGVAMGRSGSEVAREAAAMVLADDHFATIVAAIEEGRVIYDNIRKFVAFLLGCNGGEVLLMVLAAVLGWPLPLLPSQILLVNLLTDGPPALALGVEKAEEKVMNRPPRPPGESLFARGLGSRALIRSFSIALVSLWAFGSRAWEEGLGEARTLAMAVLSGSQLLYALECRSEEGRLKGRPPWGNPWLLLSILLSGGAMLAVIELPFLGAIFHLVPLEAGDWALVGGLSLLASLLARGGEEMARRLRQAQNPRDPAS